MKEKILYSSAILPDELYVERSADRKLQDVVQRMSKPAYISVARQMGKTNLLIHTKRELEDENNRYVYVDVTSDFNTAQDCFRYIVNQILNSNEDLEQFQIAKEKISVSRKESSINASEEYQNEIREILKYYKGNLIVFLDEVDDLRKHSFSDDIFGQIRKTYFIRETYSNLKRIAYILSGVIDPEKLIKTKENSPFNIAIPIYLEDFNRDEFFELVYKSGLELDNTIKDYIFEWLNGNPRMSFEILSLIEDQYINGVQITSDLVDNIIKDFYLANLKNPPIDHIRDLVNHNTDVRKALIKLKQGKIDELSDEIINKFYLFGITASKINKQNLKIKNKVLELSLSDEWINKIELEKKGYYELGIEKIKQDEHLEGIKYLQEYIQNEPKGSFVDISKYTIGLAYHDFGDYELSNKYLIEKPIKREKYTDVYYLQLSYIGINFFKLEKFDEALIYYNEIINDNKIPQTVINSFINKGEALINSTTNYEIEIIIDTYKSALEYIDLYYTEIEEIETFQAIIYFRLGYLNHSNNQKTDALKYFEKAKLFSKVEELPVILLYIDSCVFDNTQARIEVFKELADIIVLNKLIFTDGQVVIMPFIEYHLFIVLTNLYDFKLNEEYEKLLNYSINTIYNNSLQEYELLYRVAFFALRNKDINVCEELMHKILKSQDIDLVTEMVCSQFSGLIASNKEDQSSINFLTNYIRIFDENKNFKNELSENDFHSFIRAINYYRKQENHFKSYEIASILEKYFNENLSIINKALSVSILFYIMDFYSMTSNNAIAIIYAEKILLSISELKPNFKQLLEEDKKGLENFETETKVFLQKLKGNNHKQIESIKLGKEPGRNEVVNVKYKDGKEIKAKYKKVMFDLKNDKCRLIN